MSSVRITRCVCQRMPFATLAPLARARGWTLDDVMRLLGPEAEAAGVLLRREQHSRELPQIRMDAAGIPGR